MAKKREKPEPLPQETAQSNDEEIMAKQYIKDEKRSAFGLGYEYCRRKRPMSENPFPKDSWKWVDFKQGWEARRHNEEVNAKKMVAEYKSN